MSANAPIHFLIGTGRCGSTLIHETLCRHPGVAFLSNLDDRIPGFYRASRLNGSLFRRLPPAFTEKGQMRFAPSEGYRALDREIGPLVSWSRRDLVAEDATPWMTGQLTSFFDRRSDRQAGKTFVHKFTGWPRVGMLHAAYPDARFIHIVRDGREVANSWLKMNWWRGYEGPAAWQWGDLPEDYARIWEEWNRSYPLLAAIGWSILIDAWREVRASIPGTQWLEVRYEDVVESPEESFAEMAEFLGLAPSPEFERQVRSQEFLVGRLRSAHRDLPASTLKLMTEIMASHLEAYGYSLELPSES